MEKQEDERAGRSHIMVIPFPVQGHINPMLQFSKRLVSKGLKVTLVSAFMNPDVIQPQPNSAGTNLNVSVESIPYEPEPETATDQFERIDAFLERFQKLVTLRLGEVIKKQLTPVTWVVYDSVIPWALDVVKQLELGLFAASFFTQSNAVNAIYYNVHQGLLTVPVEEPSVTIMGLPQQLHICDLPSFVSHAGHSAYPSILGLVINQFSNFTKADCIFFNTFDSLEGEVLLLTNSAHVYIWINWRALFPSAFSFS